MFTEGSLKIPKYANAEEAYNTWRKYVVSFGFGNRLKCDFTNELKGFIAPATYYDRYFGTNHWNALTTISLSIGQGEILITPLQMANMAADNCQPGVLLLFRMWLKKIEGIDTIEHRFYKKHIIHIDTANFGLVAEGMELAVNGGAGSTAGIARIDALWSAVKPVRHRILMAKITPYLLLLHLKTIPKLPFRFMWNTGNGVPLMQHPLPV